MPLLTILFRQRKEGSIEIFRFRKLQPEISLTSKAFVVNQSSWIFLVLILLSKEVLDAAAV